MMYTDCSVKTAAQNTWNIWKKLNYDEHFLLEYFNNYRYENYNLLNR